MAHIVIDIKGQAVHLDATEARRILRELRELLEAEGGAGRGASVPWTAPSFTVTPCVTPPLISTTGTGAPGSYPTVVINSDIFE